MKKTLPFIILLLIILLLGASLLLGRDGVSTPEEETETALPEDNYVAETEDGETEMITENTDEYDLNAELPNERALGASVVRLAIETEIDRFKTLVETDLQELREVSGYPFTYTFDTTLDTYETSDYISYVVLIGEFTGGANANSRAESFVFDKESGEEISLSNLIPADEQDQFLMNAKARLNEKEYVFSDSVGALRFEDLSTFFIEENGDITLLFSEYEVAPGAAGIVEVTVSR